MDFEVGDTVSKVGGDYRFDGRIVAAFRKLSGAVRYVVEDERGVLFIYNGANLEWRRQELPQSTEDDAAIAHHVREVAAGRMASCHYSGVSIVPSVVEHEGRRFRIDDICQFFRREVSSIIREYEEKLTAERSLAECVTALSADVDRLTEENRILRERLEGPHGVR